ncbi:MAG: UDP-N-acetyl-D-mannosamine dehydrogenase [Bacteroidales bacterium]|nr:UDP-N-acetyl-D-mannosamine dehydrogenase [Bacteroidales bacterium]
MKACFMGLGYIGLPTAIISSQHGIRVCGVDINPEVVEKTNRGELHIVEPGLQDLLKQAVDSKSLVASTTPVESDVYLIVVPTPFKAKHKPDISYVESATKTVIPFLKEGDLFIIESTSPVGTTEKMAELIFSVRPELKGRIHIAYCPERVLPGNVIFELVNNDRVIGGIDEASADAAAEFYGKFVTGQLHKTNCRTAEMCKLVENSSRDVQIAFANELSMICEKAGINVWELISLANKHPRVNILQPGCGVGGHCIAVDPYFISSAFPKEARIIAQARRINNYKSDWCVEKAKNAILTFELKTGRKPQVALMGLAFKPNIDDLRESPAMRIALEILGEFADIDFHVAEPNIESHKDFKIEGYQASYDAADIVLYLTAHKEFFTLPNDGTKEILDFCGILK